MSTPSHRSRHRDTDHGRRSAARSSTSVDVPSRYVNALAQERLDKARFRNAGLRIGSSSVVHAVRWRERPDGITQPAPACHQGHDRPDGDEALTPVYDKPVSCRGCLTRPIARQEGQPYVPATGQWSLWTEEDGVPPLPPFPPPDDTTAI
ncbi:hypothetical protein [Actinopolyspora xinjiangensis]|uniref:hypothetical protein n=1 Tax=Actinopolyspora xinjiangensis TaxID=405564 RepID=UPI001113CE3C|nr:hypothetical protein [Actinopolyspora xinjiangensis]